MSSIFDRFNEMIDVEGLKKDLKDFDDKQNKSSNNFVEVPHGDYEVRVFKLEAGLTGERSKNPGTPMLKVCYEVIAGDYKGQKIFQNQLLHTAFGINIANELLHNFESGYPISFENYSQYETLINQVFDEIDGVGEYELAYGENAKGYPTYNIIKRFA